MRSSLLSLALSSLLALGAPSTAQAGPVSWAHFLQGQIPVGTTFTLPLSGGSTVDVTVQTGGTQGVSAADADTLGRAATGLDYAHLHVLGIFNGGGSSSVATTITFANYQLGPLHRRGLLLVGAVNGASSPITLSASVTGRPATWTVIGEPFAWGPSNDSPIDWDPALGRLTTSAQAGNDSRLIVLDLGDLHLDGAVTVSLLQHLNDGILYGFGEELTGTAAVPPPGAAVLALAPPAPNPASGRVSLGFSLAAAGRARLVVYDLAGRRLATPADCEFAAGAHDVAWDLRDRSGAPVPAGLVFVRLESAAGMRTRRLFVAP